MKLASVHRPFLLQNCTNCHTAHGTGKTRKKSKLKDPLGRLCLSCHQKIAQKTNAVASHFPVKQGGCLECHNPHASKYVRLLKRPVPTVCQVCHRQVRERLARRVHFPFEKGHCLDCHDPHGSNYKGMTREALKDLCIICHKKIATELTRVFVHLPVRESCTACHGPHAEDWPPLLKLEQTSLCYSCHSRIRSDFILASRHPVPDRLSCTSCHFAHASEFPRLVVRAGNDLCFSCHSLTALNFPNSAHKRISRTAAPGACVNCHRPHGSEFSPLLAQESVSLCASCHPSYAQQGVSHPVGSSYADAQRGTYLMCTSTCHDPHGTVNFAMLRIVPDGLCLTCHPTDTLP